MSVLQITKSANAVDIWFDDIKMYLILDEDILVEGLL